MSWKPEVEGIEERRRRALEMGGEEAVAKQHELGRLTVRERIEGLVDPGSFQEQGPLAGHSELGPDGEIQSFTPANYVLGMARVDGRPCVVGGEDFTLRGGSPSPAGLRKSIYSEDLCLRYRIPLLRFLQGGGGSVVGTRGGKGPALGGAFINFQLIALPMSELVPAGARVGGIPVSTVSALVLVLMEAALGIFLMDMLGITELFPKLATIPRSRRRLILWLCIAGLFFLSAVEGSLAILREQIVEADAALKLSLADEASRIVESASHSMIPVIGQAVLGFILPWVLALVAVPLEMLLDSGRHVAGSISVLFLRVLGATLNVIAMLIRHLTNITTNFYDVYISIPLRIETWVTGVEEEDPPERRGSRMSALDDPDETRARGGSPA